MSATITLPATLNKPRSLTKLLSAGQGLSPVLLKRAALVTLDLNSALPHYLRDSEGGAWSVRLPPGASPAHGDVLVGDDGSLLRVQGLGMAPVGEFQAPQVAATHSCCGHDHEHGHDHHHHHHA